MGKTTKIQWADSTVNPTMGCQGCELWGPSRRSCYAGKSHARKNGQNLGYAAKFEIVETMPGRMAEAAAWSDLAGRCRFEKPWLDGLPRIIFISDMGDSLSKGVDFRYLESEVIAAAVSRLGARHRWLWLTKQTARMVEFSDWLERRGASWPENLWVGTSVTSQAVAKGRIEPLLKVGAPGIVRFISLEPQFENVDLTPWLDRIDLVIQGGESGSRAEAAPFDLVWARSMRGQCRKSGTAYFLKQIGSRPVDGGKPVEGVSDLHGGEPDEWPEGLRVREWPAESEEEVSPTTPSASVGRRRHGRRGAPGPQPVEEHQVPSVRR